MLQVHLLISFLLICTSSWAQNQTDKTSSRSTTLPLLSSTELLQLDSKQQIEYLKAVRNILSEMSLQSETFSNRRPTYLLDFLLPEAYAQKNPEDDPDKLVADGVSTAYEDFKKFESEVAKYNGEISDEDAAHARRALSVLIGDVQTGTNLGRSEMVKKAKDAFNDIYSQLEKKYWNRLSEGMITNLSARKRIIDRVQKSVKGQDNTAPTARKSPGKKAEKNTPSNLAGCIYGGFALTTGPCQGVVELPEAYKSQTALSHSQFKCGKNEVICNPLLFGFETKCEESAWFTASCPELKPVCTFSRGEVTASCRNKTVDSKYYERALALIAKAPGLWDQFNADLKQVCSSALKEQETKPQDPKIRDVVKTCKETQERLAEIHKRAKNKADTYPREKSEHTK